jgi:hypothetical protein
MDKNIFILRVEISASVRQSTQIKLDDLRLQKSVIEALEKQQSVSVRPNLSGKLKEFLSYLRIEQRKLYDDCTIHQGDTHFLHEDYFTDAMQRITSIRQNAANFNELLNEMWLPEYEKWATTVSGFLEPLFQHEDPLSYKMAKEAYLSLFPTKLEFENPINVYVLGPNPVFMDAATSKDDHPLTKAIWEASVTNTNEVLEAARSGAADRACLKAAELLDDLDVRIASKIGERQTGGSKRRGSWQMTAENLQLISSHCPGFEKLTSLTKELTEVGLGLQAGEAKKRDEAYNNFAEIKVRIREELENIVATRDSSDGLELLKKSLTLSGTYKDLTLKIREAESEEQLEELYSQIELETNVYNQRAKHLQNLFTQQSEFVKSANMDLSEVLAEVRTLGAKTVEELDF